MAIKSFNRTVEAINDLLDKLDELPTYPLVYKGIRTNPSYLPEDPTEGDLYYVQYSDTNNEHVANYLYLRKATAWEIIATKSYTPYEIDTMFEAIGNGLHWRGAVSYYSNLPSDAELGDMWTVLYEGTTGTDPCGDEYAWGTLSGTEQWILIGKETYSKVQIDDMVDGLTDRIAINENNILSSLDANGAKNQLEYTMESLKAINSRGTWVNNVYTVNNVKYTVNSDMSITAETIGTPSGSTLLALKSNVANSYVGAILSGCPTGGNNATYNIAIEQSASPYTLLAQDTGLSATIPNNTSGNIIIYVVVKTTLSDPIVFNPMICSADLWAISHQYQPYALSNAELTAAIQALQAQLANQ